MAQAIDTPLASSTLFLTLNLTNAASSARTARNTLSSLSDLVKNVSIRDPSARLSCVAAIGSAAWESVTNHQPQPAELRPFPVITGKKHATVATPGDLFFHVKSERQDLCFEFERQLLDKLGDAVTLVDETWSFRYFDARDLLGFVDGTANPTGAEGVAAATLVTAGDPGVEDAAATALSGGSYVVTQKYLHDLPAWNSLSVEAQQSIIGRTKLENLELDDAPSGTQQSHKSLATIEDAASGAEHEILRANMAFGAPGKGEFGTYFIGYTRQLWVVEEMLRRMFVGEPEGLHDRILDYSQPVTGATFFAPSAAMLAGLGD